MGESGRVRSRFSPQSKNMKTYNYEVLQTTKFNISFDANSNEEADEKVAMIMSEITNFKNNADKLTEIATVRYQELDSDYTLKSVDEPVDEDDDSDDEDVHEVREDNPTQEV